MSRTSWMWVAVNWASLPILAVIVGVFVWRKLHRDFPLFFLFLIVTELVGLLRLVARYGSSHSYFYVYWISDFVFDFAGILAIYELFLLRIFPSFHKTRVYRYLFGVTAAIIAVGAWRAAASSDISAAFALVTRVLDFSIVAMLMFFGLLMLIMGRQWKKNDFAIGFGFALNNAAALITTAVWVRTHYRSSIASELPVIAFDISCLIWLITFWKLEKKSLQPVEQLDPELLQQARSWEEQLKDWVTPRKSKR
jgi:hypothetical protein